jgi:hypothetical protein
MDARPRAQGPTDALLNLPTTAFVYARNWCFTYWSQPVLVSSPRYWSHSQSAAAMRRRIRRSSRRWSRCSSSRASAREAARSAADLLSNPSAWISRAPAAAIRRERLRLRAVWAWSWGLFRPAASLPSLVLTPPSPRSADAFPKLQAGGRFGHVGRGWVVTPTRPGTLPDETRRLALGRVSGR